jgi:hypothetical protein
VLHPGTAVKLGDVIHLIMTADVVANGAGSDGMATVLQSPFICVSPTNCLSVRNGIAHSFVLVCVCVISNAR